jgi:hypothetical protein
MPLQRRFKFHQKESFIEHNRLPGSFLAAVEGLRKKAGPYKECDSGIDLKERTTGVENMKMDVMLMGY